MGNWKAMTRGTVFFLESHKISVGLLGDIKLWDDRWCNDYRLKEIFNSIFSFPLEKSGNVVNYYGESDGRGWC